MRLVGFVGWSDSGKTTVIEGLVKELKERGYRVAVLKHCPQGFDLDKKGTDSARIWAAGADGVALVGPGQMALLERVAEVNLRQMAELYFPDYDFVLIEGGKEAVGFKKIMVTKEELTRDPPVSSGELLAVVSDDPPNIDKPVFGFDQLAELADFLCQREDLERPAVILSIDDRPLPLKPFVQEILAGAVWGIVKKLKKLPERPRRLRLFLKGDREGKS